jgi:hypothetical protein
MYGGIIMFRKILNGTQERNTHENIIYTCFGGLPIGVKPVFGKTKTVKKIKGNEVKT